MVPFVASLLLLALLPLAGPVAPGVSSSSAGGGGGLQVRGSQVQLIAPASTRPLDENCFRGSSALLCGMGRVSVDLGGFDAYGGIPDCTDPDEDAGFVDCDTPLAELVDVQGTRIDVVVRCRGALLPKVRSFVTTTGPSRLAGPSWVNGQTRRSSDTARVAAAFFFPTGETVASCPNRSANLLMAVVRSITVAWEGADGIPGGTAKLPGVRLFR